MADFSDFQLKEYENISQAHFKTNEMITAFFRYYVLVMTVPITAFGALFTLSGGDKALSHMEFWQWPISVLLIAFGILGGLMMLYVTGLRCEVILYARQVNSSRSYFFEAEEKQTNPHLATLVLPRDSTSPKIVSGSIGDHDFIAMSFAWLNSLYLVASFWLMLIDPVSISDLQAAEVSVDLGRHWCGLLVAFVISFTVQFTIYRFRCASKEEKYSRDYGS
jgi:hypothetical protein